MIRNISNQLVTISDLHFAPPSLLSVATTVSLGSTGLYADHSDRWQQFAGQCHSGPDVLSGSLT